MSSDLPSPSLLSASVKRLAVPVFVFGTVFASAMFVMTALASPDRFPVRIEDKVVPLGALADEERSLKTQEQSLTQDRKALDAQVPFPVLGQVAALRSDGAHVGRALLTVDTVRKSFALSGDGPVHIQKVWFSLAEERLSIAGEVRDPTDRSIQVLAAFVDNLRSFPIFASVSEPEYVRNHDADGAAVSPFTISLSLRRGN